VSGNVSLYNETNGAAIPPTPAIGGVGLVVDVEHTATLAFKAAGDVILLAGAPPELGTHLGQSVWVREVEGREDGPPPSVDLAHEKRVGDFVRALIRDGLVTAVHDLSDGGLAVALAEMAIASGIGATVTQPNAMNPVGVFFGEDQGRYLITAVGDNLEILQKRANAAGVFMPWIGNTGGTDLKLGDSRAISVARLREAHEAWFPAYMAGP
jgi:phosphoribosylformylglycinamidine synthase